MGSAPVVYSLSASCILGKYCSMQYCMMARRVMMPMKVWRSSTTGTKF